VNKMSKIEVLKKFLDDDAIEFYHVNEKEYNKMYSEFVKINSKPLI